MMEKNRWLRPKACGQGNNCPEIMITSDSVLVRSSLDPDAPATRLTHQEWRDLADGIRNGEFDV